MNIMKKLVNITTGLIIALCITATACDSHNELEDNAASIIKPTERLDLVLGGLHGIGGITDEQSKQHVKIIQGKSADYIPLLVKMLRVKSLTIEKSYDERSKDINAALLLISIHTDLVMEEVIGTLRKLMPVQARLRMEINACGLELRLCETLSQKQIKDDHLSQIRNTILNGLSEQKNGQAISLVVQEWQERDPDYELIASRYLMVVGSNNPLAIERLTKSCNDPGSVLNGNIQVVHFLDSLNVSESKNRK